MKTDIRIFSSWLCSLLFLLSLTFGASSVTGLFAADDEEINFDEPTTPVVKKTEPAVPVKNKTTETTPGKTTTNKTSTPRVGASAITPSNPTLGGPRKLPPRTKTDTTNTNPDKTPPVQVASPMQVAPVVKTAPLEDVVPVSALLMLNCLPTRSDSRQSIRLTT